MKFISYILIAIFFVITHLQAVTFKVEKDVKLDNALKKRVELYWKYRGEKDFEHSYKYELPYERYLHSQMDYEIFFQHASKFSKIKLLKIIKCSNNICILGIMLYPKFAPNDSTYINDKWIKVSGIWYHKYIDSLLPRFQ